MAQPIATLEVENGLAWVWIVWALKHGEALLVAICTEARIAERYLPYVEQRFPGHKHHVERAPVDHMFGGSDLASIVWRRAHRASIQRRELISKE